LNYYETRRSGEIVSRLRDINEINNLVAQVVALTQPVVYCSNFFSLQLKLTLAVILIAGLMTVSTLPLLPAAKTRNLLVLAAENQGVLVETLRVQW